MNASPSGQSRDGEVPAEANFDCRGSRLFKIGGPSGRFATMSYKLALHAVA